MALSLSITLVRLVSRAGTTNRWTGATGSEFRSRFGPAQRFGNAVARSTQTFGACHNVMKLSLLTIATVFFLSGISALAKDWRGIVPLHSTRADVERLLGRPDTDRGFMIFYDVAFSRVSFQFPQSACGEPGAVWNVSANTVTDIWVTQKPPHELKLGDVKLGDGFRTEKDPELDYILNYINDADGISYEVDKSSSDIIMLTKYFPAGKDNHMRCPNLNAPNKSLDASRDSVFLKMLY